MSSGKIFALDQTSFRSFLQASMHRESSPIFDLCKCNFSDMSQMERHECSEKIYFPYFWAMLLNKVDDNCSHKMKYMTRFYGSHVPTLLVTMIQMRFVCFLQDEILLAVHLYHQHHILNLYECICTAVHWQSCNVAIQQIFAKHLFRWVIQFLSAVHKGFHFFWPHVHEEE